MTTHIIVLNNVDTTQNGQSNLMYVSIIYKVNVHLQMESAKDSMLFGNGLSRWLRHLDRMNYLKIVLLINFISVIKGRRINNHNNKLSIKIKRFRLVSNIISFKIITNRICSNQYLLTNKITIKIINNKTTNFINKQHNTINSTKVNTTF